MMDPVKINGIVLIKDEDLFIEQVLINILSFCDRIIIADNRSRDNTTKISRSFSDRHRHISYFNIASPSVSHDLIKPYAGTKSWIFGVDGDELFDPIGLAKLKAKLVAGAFKDQWMILGNVLNVIKFDRQSMTASGYLAPPCRSMTKLYNFHLIKTWEGPCSERLHGGQIDFKNGYGRDLRFDLFRKSTWEDALFRCLHMCFLRRSSLEPTDAAQLCARKNIAELELEKLPRKMLTNIRKIMRIPETSTLKREKYMRGDLVEKDVASFFK